MHSLRFAPRANPCAILFWGYRQRQGQSGFAVAALRQSLTLNLSYFTNVRLYFAEGADVGAASRRRARPSTNSQPDAAQERAGKRRGSVQTCRPRPDAKTKTFFDLRAKKRYNQLFPINLFFFLFFARTTPKE